MAMPLPVPEDAFSEGLPHREGASAEETFELFSALAPKGWRVELIEGEIYVAPPADGEHEKIVTVMVEQVIARRVDKELRNSTGSASTSLEPLALCGSSRTWSSLPGTASTTSKSGTPPIPSSSSPR
ncbi:hypothetical protein [Streptomyces sp. NPDC006477]|uniref:hypothetical protein n=1 Tax=Streptomyces sp. NPDC006477 TaxID=3364747 RepID=UPI003673B00A